MATVTELSGNGGGITGAGPENKLSSTTRTVTAVHGTITPDFVGEVVTDVTADQNYVGTGTSAKARLSSEAKNYATQAQLQLLTLLSYEAVPKFNHLVDLGKRVAAIIHITC